MSAERAPGGHEGTGEDYDADYYAANGQAGDRPALRLYTRLVARYTDGGPYLDFGCGTGHLVRRLSALGPAWGVELSQWSARTARENAPGSTVTTSVDELPTAGFGALTAIHVLEHLDDATAADVLATWRRVLRPGGHALVVMPDPAGRGRRLAGGAWMGFADPTHINLKPHREWAAFLREHGFVVEREGTDGLWDVPYSRLPRLLDAARYAVPAFVQFLAGRLLCAGDRRVVDLRPAPPVTVRGAPSARLDEPPTVALALPEPPARRRAAAVVDVVVGLALAVGAAAWNLWFAAGASAQGVITGEEASVDHRDTLALSLHWQPSIWSTNAGSQLFYLLAGHLTPDYGLFYARPVKALAMALLPVLLYVVARRRLGCRPATRPSARPSRRSCRAS